MKNRSFWENSKKNWGGGAGRGGGGSGRVWGGGSGWGDQDGCERRIKVFVKIQKKRILRGVGPGGGEVGVGLVGGQGGCE